MRSQSFPSSLPHLTFLGKLLHSNSALSNAVAKSYSKNLFKLSRLDTPLVEVGVVLVSDNLGGSMAGLYYTAMEAFFMYGPKNSLAIGHAVTL